MHTGLFAHTCIVMIYFIFLKWKEAELLFEEDGILLIWVKQNFKLHKFSSSINSSGAKIKWEETYWIFSCTAVTQVYWEIKFNKTPM